MPARDAATTAGSASPPPTFRDSSFLSSIPSPRDALRSPTSVISTESENGQGVSTERGSGEPGSPCRDRRTPPFFGAPFWHDPPATTTATTATTTNTRHSASGLPLIMSSVTTPSASIPYIPFSQTASSIRDRTVELANMQVSPPMASVASPLALDFITQHTQPPYDSHIEESSVPSSFVDKSSGSPLPQRKLSLSRPGPSKLTLQLKSIPSPIASREPSRSPGTSLSPHDTITVPPTRVRKHSQSPPSDSDSARDEESYPAPRRTPTAVSQHGRIPLPTFPPTESSSLLRGTFLQTYSTLPAPPQTPGPLLPASNRSLRKRARAAWKYATNSAKTVSKPSQIAHLGFRIFSSLPAVFLGLLLNILDGVSYGMILFPSGTIFNGFGPMGVSLFFVTTVIAQLVFTFGGSNFAGGNGSMMIEVVPFFNILTSEITEIVGEDNPQAVIATTLVAFAFSSLLTGAAFFILGRFRLGAIMGFFPRHILVGCIGGVGWFLIETGFEVSVGMNEEGGFQYNWDMAKLFFGNKHNVSLWAPALGLAVMLRIITTKFQHQLVFPIYFFLIPIIFYIVVLVGHFDLSTLRRSGWIFDVGTDNAPWWQIYTYYDFSQTCWRAILQTMPTQFALLFFNILHPPLNVPALAVSLDQDIDTNHELISHGYSNFLAGLLGTTPNYLVYVNTVLFYRVGGGTRLAGFLLAMATVVVLLVGTAPIGYLPVMLVGALIFVLGIDLVREALWDTRHRVNRTEYITILSIMVCMTIFDFVIGVLFGIALACFFFVVQNSRNPSIRAVYTGDTAISTVRRPSAHRAYLQEVGRQTMIMKLQYYLFFGTITHVEEAIRRLLETAQWAHNPIRFLVLDFTLVPGIDLSASEAFVRVQRSLASKGVTLVLCGFAMDSPIGLALQSVELFEGQNVEVFSDINQAIEWTENVFLKAWFDSVRDAGPEANAIAFPGRQKFILELNGSPWENSPRKKHIRNAGGRTMRPQMQPVRQQSLSQYSSVSSSHLDNQLRHQPREEPIPTLMKTFSGYENDLSPELFVPMLPYFKQTELPEGQVLWRRGDPPDGLYVIAAGVMRATYTWDNTDSISESMVAGTLAGELTGLAGMPRNADVMAEKASVLWRLSNEDWALFKKERPTLAHRFVELVLKVAKNDYDALISACSRH